MSTSDKQDMTRDAATETSRIVTEEGRGGPGSLAGQADENLLSGLSGGGRTVPMNQGNKADAGDEGNSADPAESCEMDADLQELTRKSGRFSGSAMDLPGDKGGGDLGGTGGSTPATGTSDTIERSHVGGTADRVS